MDVDAFVAVQSPAWRRLEELLRRRDLTGDEVDELVALYQRTATHLSVLRGAGPDAVLLSQLSRLVARARTRLAGTREPAWREVARFLTVSFPVAVYRIRWWVATVAVCFLVVAVAAGAWVATDPAALAAMGGEEDLRRYVERDFVDYYSQNTAASFAGQVWTNNAWVAALCVAFGITGVPVLLVLLQNAVGVGTAGGLLLAYDRGGVFFSFILPHGMLELTCVFVAAAAGLRLFWAWVSPGPRLRSDALATEGRSLVSVAVGLVGVLALSGVVEGFVTPAPWPTAVRVGIGAFALACFLGYVAVLGGRAERAGETGDLRAVDVEDRLPTTG